jgi:hypothetical protein
LKTLIVEFQISGHYPEYLKHVLTQINKDDKSDEFIFFLTPYLEQHLTAFKNTSVYNSIHFFDKNLAVEYANFANTKQMANFILEQIFNIKKHFQFNHVLFLNLSLVLRNNNILNPFKKLSFSFSGIVMNSPYRVRESKNSAFLKMKRELPLKLLIKNKKCSKIFLLNDKKGVSFYKKWSNKIKFIVRDNGLGISKSNIEKLFKPYVQINNEKSSEIGTGLGLVITKQIVNMHGGEIGVQSNENGSQFWLLFLLN